MDSFMRPGSARNHTYVHCDVFSRRPYGGNSLAVFTESDGLTTAQMLLMTRELRHFESIFLKVDGNHIVARVFDLMGELPFAGHPIIGAACTVHQRAGIAAARRWHFRLADERIVEVITKWENGILVGRLDQGPPEFLGSVPKADCARFVSAFNLSGGDLLPLPLEIISTGLKYLIVPVRSGLSTAKIVHGDLADLLRTVGAEFAYLFDVEHFEGRHWNNDGVVEDVATGSAAGTVAGYCLRHGLMADGVPKLLRQGRFLERPSEIEIVAFGTPEVVTRVEVAGAVSFVGEGTMVVP